MDERGLKISRKKTECLRCDEHQDAEIHLSGIELSLRCDGKINVKINGKVYRKVVRP